MAGADISRVLVVGAGGYFGRILVEELLEYTQAHVVLAGRNPEPLTALHRRLDLLWPGRVELQVLDLAQSETVAPAVSKAQIAICAAGPFQGLPTILAEESIKRGVHYIDIADDREFVKRIYEVVEKTDGKRLPSICPGWSTVPALSALLCRIAADHMEQIESIQIHMAPGNRVSRNVGTVASLLSSAGKSFSLCRKGEWEQVRGWTEPGTFQFPKPVGARLGYLVDVPDHQIFPELFKAETVEFRVGSELSTLNKSLSVLAWLRRKGFVKSWTPWAQSLAKAASALGWMGHDWGALGTQVQGKKKGSTVRQRVSIVSERLGQRIPIMPAVILASLLLSGKIRYEGLVPLDKWLRRSELESECARRGYRLVVERLEI